MSKIIEKFSLNGQTALVTGGAGIIGPAVHPHPGRSRREGGGS